MNNKLNNYACVWTRRAICCSNKLPCIWLHTHMHSDISCPIVTCCTVLNRKALGGYSSSPHSVVVTTCFWETVTHPFCFSILSLPPRQLPRGVRFLRRRGQVFTRIQRILPSIVNKTNSCRHDNVQCREVVRHTNVIRSHTVTSKPGMTLTLTRPTASRH